MYCQTCQAPNNRANLFCTACGTRLAPPPPDQAARPQGFGVRSAKAGTAGTPGGIGTPDRLGNPDNLGNPGTGGFSPDAEGIRRERQSGHHPGPVGYWPADSPHPAPAPPSASEWPRVNGMAVARYEPPAVVYGYRPALPVAHVVCANCGFPRPSRLETCPNCGRVLMNNSGQNTGVPAELASGWNWGAFVFPVFWSISHETWFGLLALVPGVDLVVRFVLAARGNELAWQNRRFQGVEHYQEVQRVWRNCAIGFSAVMAALFVMLWFAMAGG